MLSSSPDDGGKTENRRYRTMTKGADAGMNAAELQEFKAALLKAERYEILEILRNAQTLEDAVTLIEQRIRA